MTLLTYELGEKMTFIRGRLDHLAEIILIKNIDWKNWTYVIFLAVLRIQIQGAKYHPKLKKQTKNSFYPLDPNLSYWKKRDYKNSWFLNGSSSFSIKIRQKIRKFCFVKKIQYIFKEMTWIRIHFLPVLNQGSGSASKLNGF